MIEFVKYFGAFWGIAGILYGAGDQVGWRPMWKWEGDIQQKQFEDLGLYITRQRLIDRIEDGSITQFQRGVLSGICQALRIKKEDCEKRDQ